MQEFCQENLSGKIQQTRKKFTSALADLKNELS